MTKTTKTKAEPTAEPTAEPDLSQKNRGRIADDEVQKLLGDKISGVSFWKRIRKLFLGTVYCISVAVFGALFSVVALVLLPIILPAAYIVGQVRGRDIRLGNIQNMDD